jgi:hypothetical protein
MKICSRFGWWSLLRDRESHSARTSNKEQRAYGPTADRISGSAHAVDCWPRCLASGVPQNEVNNKGSSAPEMLRSAVDNLLRKWWRLQASHGSSNSKRNFQGSKLFPFIPEFISRTQFQLWGKCGWVRRPGFQFGSGHVGFVVNKVALRQVFS